MNWKKIGQIFSPKGESNWMNCYASQVCPIEFNNFIRVYFTTRSKLDSKGNYEAKITFIDCDKNNPDKILYIHDKPLLQLGKPGSFDEHGTMMSEILFYENKYWLYYLGWQRSNTVPYITTLGLALSEDGINFQKVSDGPVIGLNQFIPFGVAKSSIIIENGKFNMWYTHYNPWVNINNQYRPTYDIRFAESDNGLEWSFKKHICLPPSHNSEVLGTPCVKKIGDKYHMWFGYRENFNKGENYKMGYAASYDKINWKRDNSTNVIPTSLKGWDSEMVCYPYILPLKDNIYMFYSGNNYGEQGFGYSKLI
jgi:hypothetical protein